MTKAREEAASLVKATPWRYNSDRGNQVLRHGRGALDLRVTEQNKFVIPEAVSPSHLYNILYSSGLGPVKQKYRWIIFHHHL